MIRLQILKIFKSVAFYNLKFMKRKLLASRTCAGFFPLFMCFRNLVCRNSTVFILFDNWRLILDPCRHYLFWSSDKYKYVFLFEVIKCFIRKFETCTKVDGTI